MNSSLEIITMAARQDERGSAFALPQGAVDFLDGIIAEAHLAEILPGHIRGNHWHNNRWEVVVASCQDSWSFAWAESEGQPVQFRTFTAGEAVTIMIPPFVPHAMKNTGSEPLWITAISNGKYDGETQDTFSIELFVSE